MTRECEVLLGLGPSKAPVDFVLPDMAQSLAATLRDMDIPALGINANRSSWSGAAAQAVGEFNDEEFLQTDLEQMRRAYGLPGPAPKISIEGRHRWRGQTTFGNAGEGSLDLQVITTVAPNVPTSWWSIKPFDMDGFMLAYVVQVNDHASPPLVHSISWGDAEAIFPPVIIQRLDYELMKLALRGITVLISSGDNGNSAINSGCLFISDVVGSSPWVTSVGATMTSLDSAPYCLSREFQESMGVCVERGAATCSVMAGALITSSGYWSVYRGRPAYQDAAVEEYLQTSPCTICPTNGAGEGKARPVAPCHYVNGDGGCALEVLARTRRGAPDISGPGHNFLVMVNGSIVSVDGTSASAPALAAMVSLLNEEQRRRGKPPLGFLNPWLYSIYATRPDAFVDVVVGDTGSTEEERCAWGWKAGPGWDPATGLGVPRFTALRELLPDASAPSTTVGATALNQVERPPRGPMGGGLGWPVALALAAVTVGASGALGLPRRLRELLRSGGPPGGAARWHGVARPLLEAGSS